MKGRNKDSKELRGEGLGTALLRGRNRKGKYMAFPLSLAPQNLAIAFQRQEYGRVGLWCSPPAASQDEEGAIVMLKRHLRQQRTVEEYGRNIKQLAGRAQSLLSAGHPEGYVCLLRWHGRFRASIRPGTLQTQRGRNGTGFPRTRGFWTTGCPCSVLFLGLCPVLQDRPLRLRLYKSQNQNAPGEPRTLSFEELAYTKRP